MRTLPRLAAAGAGAGLVFALFCGACYATGGRGPWLPLNLVAHTAWRGAPTDDRLAPGSLLLALILLGVTGMVMFVPFLALGIGAGISPPLLVPAAAVYANVVWVFGDYLVWPKLDAVAAAGFSPGVAWVGHIVAGLAAGLMAVWPQPWPRLWSLLLQARSTVASGVRGR
jgi:hypothetical protein